MPTIEYKYEKGRTVYWASEGVPRSPSEILTKISECTIDRISLVQKGACQVIKYDVYGVFGNINVNEECLFESEDKAYTQLYNRIKEQIDVDQEKIDKLKILLKICAKEAKGNYGVDKKR
jgi:hypothetical protein